MLLLKRSSPHNNRKWGLPGGNVETGDGELIDTAKREATEEMGKLPALEVKGEILITYALRILDPIFSQEGYGNG